MKFLDAREFDPPDVKATGQQRIDFIREAVRYDRLGLHRLQGGLADDSLRVGRWHLARRLVLAGSRPPAAR